jgi:hypothetical protein
LRQEVFAKLEPHLEIVRIPALLVYAPRSATKWKKALAAGEESYGPGRIESERHQ